MSKITKNFTGSSIDEISGDRIKKELLNVVEKRLNSKNFKLFIEPGSKKGINPLFKLNEVKLIDSIRCDHRLITKISNIR